MEQSEFPIFDPNGNTEIITSYADPISVETFVNTLVDSYDTHDDSHPNEPRLKIPLLAQSIEGLHLHVEEALYNIENQIVDQKISIQTLPHHTGNDHELISVIQPTAWILNDSGCYYDPVENRIMKNCVGYWDGNSSSISDHIYQTITNGCFMSYHFIVLISIIACILMYFLMEKTTFSIILIFIVSLGYDLIAMLVITLMETFPSSENPRLASKVQQKVKSEIENILEQIFYKIPESALMLIISQKNMSFSQISGTFILRYFYEPAVTMLSQSLKNSSTAMYHKNKAKNLTWNEVENLLIVYRFVREISSSVVLGTDEIQLDSNLVYNLRMLLIALIENGQETVHIQLLRLLYKSAISPDQRSNIIVQNPRDLSLNHYIGSAECESIRIELKKIITKPRTQRNNQTMDIRYGNIMRALDPNNNLSMSTSTSTNRL